jgi:hypothetical protein
MADRPTLRQKRSHSGSNKRERCAKPILVRLSPDERLEAEEAANRAGLSLAGYTRGKMLGRPSPRAVRRPPVEKQELARLLGELGKIGSNLNQLAKAANMTTFSPFDRDELQAQLQGLGTTRAALMKALGRTP